jgi:uncharacterized protein (TIGR00251 family)
MQKDGSSSFQLNLKVTPNASRSEIVGYDGEQLRVKIAAVPEDGKANKALLKYLKRFLKPCRVQLDLLSGETSRIKTIRVEGMTRADFDGKIEAENMKARS